MENKVLLNKLVLVEWDDSNVEAGWVHIPCADRDVAHCRTPGILLFEDDKKVVIAFGDSNCGMVHETLTIPKGCITRIRELRVK